jgi:2-C-methyl-D-erythritol 4-phosphate cytidylyltransferase
VRASAIVLAAGDATRFGELKQFAAAGGVRLVDHVVETAGSVCDAVVVVLPPSYLWDGPPVDARVTGGPTRAASVRCGLRAITRTAEIIVVHDVAHPLASRALFESVIRAVADGSDAAIPALPLTEPIKRVRAHRIVETLSRDELMIVQTPHAFRADVLRSAHSEETEAIEDSSMVEDAGGTIAVVPGDPRNLHVTTPADLVLVARFLSED